MSQQIFAVIKRSSKYSHQQPRAFGNGLPKAGQATPFPVVFRKGMGDYCVSGNSNQYRIADLNFLVKIDDNSAWPFVELRS